MKKLLLFMVTLCMVMTGMFPVSAALEENSEAKSSALQHESLDTQAVAAAVQYYAYTSGGSRIGIYDSMFKAIDATYSYGSGAYVKKDDSQVVFTRGSASTYYKYQFTAYYGSTTSVSEADDWINGYQYSHVIRGDGTIYKNSYSAIGTPDAWSLEPQSGGYVYKFAKVYNDYRKMSATIELANARLKASPSGEQNFNAYVYMSSQNGSVTADAGILCGWANGGDWVLCSNVGGNFQSYGKICGSTLVNGEYVPDANIQMTYSYTTGSITLTVKNLSTGVVLTQTVYDSRIGGNMALISGTSYVPDISAERTPDLRTGAYFKNIIYKDWKIYNSSGTSYAFWATSTPTNYVLTYNDDCCTLSRTSTSETVDIFYDRPYTE